MCGLQYSTEHLEHLVISMCVWKPVFLFISMIFVLAIISQELVGFHTGFKGGGRIKCVRKHITCASLRKIIELHFNLNLHTTVSINTVNLFVHCTISIV